MVSYLIGREFQSYKMEGVMEMSTGDGCTTLCMCLIPLC